MFGPKDKCDRPSVHLEDTPRCFRQTTSFRNTFPGAGPSTSEDQWQDLLAHMLVLPVLVHYGEPSPRALRQFVEILVRAWFHERYAVDLHPP